jgi:hypothetical protein
MLGYKPSGINMPSQQRSQPSKIPAPMSGINAQSGLSEMAPDEAIFMKNIYPARYGCRVRSGYTEYATNVGTGGTRTIISYVGSDPTEDRLFATGEDGIYDVTGGGASPTLELAFGSVDAESGYGHWAAMVTIAGHFLAYCDETNGYKLYTESTGNWTTVAMGAGAGEVSGVDPASFAFVTLFKSKLWFVVKDSSQAWYLPTGSIAGTATLFDFGSKFKHGGNLVALYNWTIDGGEGIDDYLVAISSTGDVIIYKGNDPSSASDFVQHGQWYIGQTPVGRRIAGAFGGELYIISAYGLIPLTKLIAGALIQQEDIYVSRKINPLINEQMKVSRTSLGWEVRLVPADNLLMIATPKRTGLDYLQFVQSLNTEGWSTFYDIPYLTGDTWLDGFYIGDENNRVLLYTGNADNVALDGTGATDIEFSSLQTFQEEGTVGAYKRVQFIRPVFVASAAPAYIAEARYDYNLSEVFGSPSSSTVSGALWDSAVWDTDLWSVGIAPIDPLRGGSGMGRTIAIGINGNSQAETILVRTDIHRDQGWTL